MICTRISVYSITRSFFRHRGSKFSNDDYLFGRTRLEAESTKCVLLHVGKLWTVHKLPFRSEEVYLRNPGVSLKLAIGVVVELVHTAKDISHSKNHSFSIKDFSIWD